MGAQNFLHTKSSYALEGIEAPIVNDLFSSKYRSNLANLQARERSVYAQFGASSYEHFRKIIRDFFPPNDIKFYQFFSHDNVVAALNKEYGVTRGQGGGKRPIEIIFEAKSGGKNVDITGAIADLLNSNGLSGNKYISISAHKQGGTALTIDLDPATIKQTLNKLFNRNFKESSSNLLNVDTFLKNITTFAVPEIIDKSNLKIVGSTTSGTSRAPYIGSYQAPSPFQYSAADFRAAKDDPLLMDDLMKARGQILTFLVNYSSYASATPQMQRAFMNTWNSNIAGNITNLALLEKNGLLYTVVGSFGEFQTALLMNYLQQSQFGKITSPSVISDTLKSEQDRVDVRWLNKVGVQSKNYSYTKGRKDIESTVYLKTLIEQKKGYTQISNPEHLYGFLANYYFNSSFQEQTQNIFLELQSQLDSLFGEIANMQVQSDFEDSISFYTIGDRYLIPASEVYRSFFEQYTTTSVGRNWVKIEGPSPVGDDSSFNNLFQDKRKKANFSYYWKPDGHGGFNPTVENQSYFQNLISKSISLKTSFNYTKDLDLSKYVLF